MSADDHLRIECPQCGAQLKVAPDLAGRAVQCPRCSTVTHVPAPQPVAPAPPAAAPQAAAPSLVAVVRANRAMAGSRCPACGREVMLGDEVVQCPACAETSHADCWEQRGGCVSATCAPQHAPAPAPAGPAARPGLIPIAGPTKACPACAEQIPANAGVCPYCSETLGVAARVGTDVPDRFEARSGFLGTKWHFQVTDDQLIGRGPRPGEEIRVAQREAHRDLSLRQRRMVLMPDGHKRAFVIDDLAAATVDAWASGRATTRTSTLARDAFVGAIVGAFLCWLSLPVGVVAIVQGVRAQQQIDRHPRLLRGKGLAVAAMVIGVFDAVVGALMILAYIAGQAAP